MRTLSTALKKCKNPILSLLSQEIRSNLVRTTKLIIKLTIKSLLLRIILLWYLQHETDSVHFFYVSQEPSESAVRQDLCFFIQAFAELLLQRPPFLLS